MPEIRDLTAADFERVLKPFQQIGRKRFLAEYPDAGADRTPGYFILWEGRLHDLKAVVHAAYDWRFGTPLLVSPYPQEMREAVASLADRSIRAYQVPRLARVTIPDGDNGFRTVCSKDLVNRKHFHIVRDFGDGTVDTDGQDRFLQRLDDIVADLGGPEVPWIFREANGGIRKIDKGRARFALNGWRARFPSYLEADDYLTGIVVGDAAEEVAVEAVTAARWL